MKKLLTLLGAVGLTATASTAVVACGNPKTPAEKVELSTIIKTKAVEVEKGKKEDKAAILVAVKAANKDLDETQVEVKVAEGKVTVDAKADSTKYTGTVEITVTEKDTQPETVELSTVITVKAVEVEKGKKEDQVAILAAVKAANKDLDETQVEVKIVDAKVTVEAKSDSSKYTGTVEITVTEAE